MGARSLVAALALLPGCQLVFGADEPRLADGADHSDGGLEVLADTPIDAPPDTPGDGTLDTPDGIPPCMAVSTTWLDWCAMPVATHAVTLDGTLVDANDRYSIDTDAAGLCEAATTTGGTQVCLIHATSVAVTHDFFFTGAKPVAIYADTTVSIPFGVTLAVASTYQSKGAGAGSAICGQTAPTTDGGGAGGTAASIGANGGNHNGTIGLGGIATQTAITPTPGMLAPGCNAQSGAGGANGGRGGYGGGVIYLGANVALHLQGNVRADGGGGLGGMNDGGGGGGGAGGLIIFETNSLDATGIVAANGGGGGEGGDASGGQGAHGQDGYLGGAGGDGANGGGPGGAGALATTDGSHPLALQANAVAGGSTASGDPHGGGGGGGGYGTLQLSVP